MPGYYLFDKESGDSVCCLVWHCKNIWPLCQVIDRYNSILISFKRTCQLKYIHANSVKGVHEQRLAATLGVDVIQALSLRHKLSNDSIAVNIVPHTSPHIPLSKGCIDLLRGKLPICNFPATEWNANSWEPQYTQCQVHLGDGSTTLQ